MKKNIISIITVLILGSQIQAYDDSQMRKNTANRITDNYNILIDWQNKSLSELIDIESRISTSNRIKKNYNLSFDWKIIPLAKLIDIESKISTASRIKQNHGVEFNWETTSLTKLIDAESRISTASRLSKILNKPVNWRDYSISQLISAENKANETLYSKQKQQYIQKPITRGYAIAPQSSVIETTIDGEFQGWEGETIVKLMNGQIWQQTEYYYEYMYSYMPNVLIYNSHGIIKMKVEGIQKSIEVEQLR